MILHCRVADALLLPSDAWTLSDALLMDVRRQNLSEKEVEAVVASADVGRQCSRRSIAVCDMQVTSPGLTHTDS